MAKTTKKVSKSRNAGTMTESAFWSFVRSSLRRRTIGWKPVSICKANARRKYSGPNNRQKFEYQCNKCKNYFPDKEISVDHIIPAGSLTCSQDLPGFVDRLFVELEGLQCLCSTCHNAKSIIDNANGKKK